MVNEGPQWQSPAGRFNEFLYNGRSELTDAKRYLGTNTADKSQPVSAEDFVYAYDNIGNP